MSKITVPNSEKKMVGLTRSAHGLLALEPRFMFDGAAVDMVADKAAEVAVPVNVAMFQAEAVTALRAEIVQKAQSDIKTYLANKDALSLYAIFGDLGSQPSAAWIESAQKLINDVLSDRVSVQVKSLADGQMLGALGAFSAGAEQGTPVIYLNDRLLQSADNQKTLERVLVEEFGHFIDARINTARDSAGDEGQRFAAQILGEDETSQYAATENDSAKIQVGDLWVDVELASAPEVSVTFDKGYFGIQGTNTNQANDIYNLSSKGISRIAFVQTDANGDGKFGDGGTQGNDLAGTLRITLADGSVHNLAGALNWRETTGSKVEVFGFILNDGQSLTRTFTVNSITYNLSLDGGSTKDVSSTIGLQAFNSTWTFTNLEDRSGNAATSGLLKALNDYLDLTPQPLSISANSVTEGQSLVYTVTLDSTTTTSFTYPFTLSYGSGFTADDYSGALSSSNFSNGVTFNADGTITVPTGVTSFTITLATVSDAFSESRETATVTIGAKSATGSVVDAGTDTINVTSYGPVNEGSTYALFTVEASGSQILKLSVLNGATELVNPTIQYLSGESWVTYVEGTSMPSGGTVYVRVAISSELDDTYEGPEDFSLVATNSTNAAITDTESTYIVDDGTGSRYDGALTAGIPNSSGISLDDDRSITVTGLDDVSEGSNAVFTVTLEAGRNAVTEITLALANGQGSNDAAESGDYVATYSNDGSDATKAAVYYYVGSVQTFLSVTDGKINLPANVTTFYVRVPSTQDTSFEGKEDFQLTATVTSGKSGADTSTIVDDGSGKVYDDKGANGTGPGNDDRSITVTGLDDVSEGSNAVFTVTLEAGRNAVTEITLALANGQGSNDAAESGDYVATYSNDGSDATKAAVYYYVGSVQTFLSVTDGKINLPANVTTFYVRVPSTQDTSFEGKEDFQLTATVTSGKSGADTSTIVDDGSGKVYDDKGANGTGPGNDDRSITVTGLDDVSEGSNAVFTVTLEAGRNAVTEITLALANGQGSNDAAESGDYVATYSNDGSDATKAAVYYYVGSVQTFLSVTDGKINLPANVTTFYVRVPSTQDTSFEGKEDFQLTATVTSGKSGADTSTIVDDGSGKVYDDKGANGTGPGNDDRSITVTGLDDVSEGSNAVFTVTLEAGRNAVTEITLALANGQGSNDAAESGDYVATYSNDGSDATKAAVYYYVGSVQTFLSVTDGKINLPANVTTFYVRVPSTQDTSFEGKEDFQLTATVTSGKSGADTSTIVDDGSGKVYDDKGANGTGPGNDDRSITVTGLDDVSEGSNAVFTVTLEAGRNAVTEITLALANGQGSNDAAESGDYVATYSNDGSDATKAAVYYYVGSVQTFLSVTDGKINLPANVTTFYVRVPSTQDTSFEGKEDFQLTATVTSGKSGADTSTIVDDGSGKVYDDKGANGTGPGNDDRSITVTGLDDVSEGSNAVFTVTLEAGRNAVTEITLALANGQGSNDAAESGDYVATYSNDGSDATKAAVYYYVGSVQTFLSVTDGKINLPANVTTFYVRVPSTQDTSFEGKEDFQLTATVTSGKSGADTSIIVDDGSGKVYDDKGANGTGPGNDDRSITVTGLDDVSEGSNAVFTVTLEAGRNAVTEITLALANGQGSNDAAESGDYVATYSNDGSDATKAAVYYYVGSVQTFLSVTDGKINLPANVTTFYVRVPSTQDTSFEGKEDFQLTATVTSGKSGADTSTIVDDGSGKVYDDKGANGTGPGNDDRSITVTGLDDVSEGSNAVFTVTLEAGRNAVTEITLALANGQGSNDAAESGDYVATYSNDGSDATKAAVYYYVGSVQTFLSVTDGKINLPANVTTFYVRVPSTQDTSFEGKEDFQLTATVTSGKSGADTSTIVDDGSGKVYDDKGANGTGPGNDDRSITVTGLDDVSEGSNAVFTVTLEAGRNAVTEITLALANGQGSNDAAESGDYVATYSNDGSDATKAAVYYYVGSVQTFLSVTDGKINLPANVTTFYVRVPSTQDTSFEGKEDFQLTATVTSGKSGADTSIIVDDGSGKVYDDKGANGTGPGNDDRSITVTGLDDVSEGSNAVFTVTLEAGRNAVTEITLALANGQGSNDAAESGDYVATYSNDGSDATKAAVYYYVGSVQTFLSVTDGKINLPANVTTFYVRVPSTQDTSFEGKEDFQLTATVTSGKSGADTSTIVDDGSGKVYDDKGANGTGPGNDDRSITVTGLDDVSEGSNAVFTVTLEAGRNAVTEITLALANGQGSNDAAESGDYVATYSNDGSDATKAAVYYYVGSVQTFLSVTDGKINLPANVTTFYVRVPSTQDTSFEGKEDFQLTATVTSGKSGADTSTIVDDGSGKVYDDKGANGTGPGNDDRSITVTGLDDVSEGSNAVFTVTLEAGRNAVTEITLALANGQGSNDAAESGDYVATYSNDGSDATKAAVYYYVGSVQTFLSVTDGKINLPANVTTFYVRVPSTQDTSFEGKEDFQLTATVTSGKSGADTSIIVDDGSGKVYDDKGANGTGPGNDDRSITVTGLDDVSEGSNAVFTVTLEAGRNAVTEITLALANGQGSNDAAESGDYVATYSNDGSDATKAAVYYYVGSVQTFLSVTDGKINLPANVTTFYVRVPSTQDTSFEGKEDFQLTATVTSGKSGADTSTIVDDGSGKVYDDKGANGTGPGNDDRPVLSVAGVDDVSEGSYAVFTVSLDKALEGTTGIKLSLEDNSALISNDLTGSVMEVVTSLRTPNGSGTLISNDGTFSLPAGITTFYVRVLTKSDQPAVYEGAEKFALRASFTSAALLYADRTGVNVTVRSNASSADTSIILDDGTGKVYKPDGTEDLNAIKDDDRPKPEPLPLTVLPAAAPILLAERVELPPPAPQVFSSTLDPIAPRLVPIEPPRPIGDVLTSQSGYRIPVNDAAASGLSLNRGVTDQFVQGTQVATKISLPFDAFIHSDKDAVIKLEAKQADNRPLPNWVQFDPVSGVFEVTPPKGFKGKLDLKVVARDDDGREATALFQLFVGEQEKVNPQSRESFSEKLRMAGKRPMTLIRVSDAQGKLTVRESVPHKARAG